MLGAKCLWLAGGFPRIRGDVPTPVSVTRPLSVFSPHTRGCSVRGGFLTYLTAVFPAYAGMFLKVIRLKQKAQRFPRIRGDVPYTVFVYPLKFWFSPHTRGCSGHQIAYLLHLTVFPAYAGMFLLFLLPPLIATSFPRIRGDVPAALIRCGLRSGFPRIRGDVPGPGFPRTAPRKFSPHTRGCSAQINNLGPIMLVFPAYAGMFRIGQSKA